MFFYFSGTPKCDKYQQLENSLISHRLFSLHGAYERAVINWFDHPKIGIEANLDKPKPAALLADSGAFTAWRSGHVTSIGEVLSSYGKFFERADKYFKEVWAVNLDVIPGNFGRDPTLEEIKEAIRISDVNFKILTDTFGPRILPVYHQGEPLERALELEQLTMVTSKYICVSPRNDLPEKQRVIWSQQVHAKLKSETKTHGLATTGNQMLERVPWYSVDSSTWVGLAIFGKSCFYWDKGTKKTYSIIGMSNEGGHDRFQGQHYDSVSEPIQKEICYRINEMGFTLEQVKTDARCRMLFNLVNLKMYAEKVGGNKNIYAHQDTLFGI